MTNSSQFFCWEGYGLRIHVRSNSLPKNVEQCTINIKASIAGQYEFPENHHVVSATYWLHCFPACKFNRPISLEIQHCAPRDNIHIRKLSIVRARSTQNQPPYTFKKVPGGIFSAKSSYGCIKLSHFSGVAVTSPTDEREYCGHLFYSRLRPEFYFLVTWNAEIHIAVSLVS